MSPDRGLRGNQDSSNKHTMGILVNISKAPENRRGILAAITFTHLPRHADVNGPETIRIHSQDADDLGLHHIQDAFWYKSSARHWSWGSKRSAISHVG